MKFSGSTMNSCYFIGNKIYCSNIGDSRSIAGIKNSKTGEWKSK
jgi:serine/threonine protein phosphatase PrpC